MSKEPEHLFEYGDGERRQEFGEKYIRLLQSMPNLKKAFDAVLKAADTTSDEAKIIYGLARIAVEEEFQAMIVLCANGYSNSAKQTMRGLFEKVVTLRYLNKHHEEMDAFMNYVWIDRRKKFNRMKAILQNPTQSILDQQKHVEVEAKKVEGSYPRGQWGKRDMVGMANNIGLPTEFIEVGYYWGLAEAHPKLDAINARIEERTDGSLWWKDDLPSLDECDLPLKIAHCLVLSALETLKDYFKAHDTGEVISDCMKEYLEVWGMGMPEGKE